MTRDPNDMVRAYAGPLVLVEVYQAALKEAGVESRVVGTELSGGFGSVLPASVELWVHRGDLSRAEAAIERMERLDDTAEYFPHPTDSAKPASAPYRHEPYVNSSL
jgi:hypothetical protein